MRNLLTVSLAVLLLAGIAQAETTLSLRQESCPVAGMSRYVVTAATGSAEPVSAIGKVIISGAVHQVWDVAALGGAPSPQIDSLDPSRPADWFEADTCLLIADDPVGDHGFWIETNDGLMGGSGLPQFLGYDATTGMGTFGEAGDISEVIGPAQQSPTFDFMQVVIPTGEVVRMDVRVSYDMWGTQQAYFYGYPIPEPATLGLLALGGAVFVRKRRR